MVPSLLITFGSAAQVGLFIETGGEPAVVDADEGISGTARLLRHALDRPVAYILLHRRVGLLRLPAHAILV